MEIKKLFWNLGAAYFGYFLHVVLANSGDASFADFAETFGDIFGSLQQCHYKCANGASPTERQGYQKTSNGCGSYGVKMQMGNFPELTSCCDQHDFCYDTCNSKKNECDRKFKQCIDQACKLKWDKQELDERQTLGCKAAAKLIYGGTAALGCNAYLEAQGKACTCHHGTGSTHHHHKHNRSGGPHRRHNTGHAHGKSDVGLLKDIAAFLFDHDEL